MNKMLVLYYSGVGNTKRVSEVIASNLSIEYIVDIYSIENLPNNFSFDNYKAMVIGFPTIHSSPAKPINIFLDKLDKLKKPIVAYIFTTFGLYSCNTLRILAKKCSKKNIIPILNKGYRCKAIDGILLTPFMKYWFSDEKNLNKKLKKDTYEFTNLIDKHLSINIPRMKIYSILNYPNKLLGEAYSFKIYLHKERCIKCCKCITNCPVKAYEVDKCGLPKIYHKKCINCYRCIHHCPKMALSLSKKKPPKKTLYTQ